MILDSFRLDGKVAVVTGSTRGLGQGAALALAEAGADLALWPRTMFELINASSGASWVFEDRMARALIDDFDPPRAASRILTKDIGLATTLAASVGHATPLGDAFSHRRQPTHDPGSRLTQDQRP